MKQLTGVVKIRVAGTLVRSKKGAKLSNISGKTREVVEENGFKGFTEDSVAPRVEFTVMHTGDFKIVDMANLKSTSITFECDSGATYVLEGCVCLSSGELSNGEAPFEFAAETCTEQAGTATNE